jgi:succinate dehydrogenase hydrophobic anchor subunit
MLRCLVTAVILTAMIAGAVGPWLHIETVEVYAAVAFAIGALGNKWLEIFDALKTRLATAILGGKQ